jgi:hypothetical protein
MNHAAESLDCQPSRAFCALSEAVAQDQNVLRQRPPTHVALHQLGALFQLGLDADGNEKDDDQWLMVRPDISTLHW